MSSSSCCPRLASPRGRRRARRCRRPSRSRPASCPRCGATSSSRSMPRAVGPVVELGLEDRAPRVRVGQVDPDVAVEAARAGSTAGSRCSIEFVAAITSSPPLAAVRLERGQQLVDRAPRLLVGRVVAPLRDRVELVEEEQARQVLLAPSRTPCRCSAPSRPTIPETRSPVETWMKLRPYSPAIACAKNVLPTPGRAVEQDAVPLDPVALGLLGVLEHQPDGVAHLLLERLHPADVLERRQLVRRLHLEVAAAVAACHPAAEERRRAGSAGPARRRSGACFGRSARPALGLRLGRAARAAGPRRRPSGRWRGRSCRTARPRPSSSRRRARRAATRRTGTCSPPARSPPRGGAAPPPAADGRAPPRPRAVCARSRGRASSRRRRR